MTRTVHFAVEAHIPVYAVDFVSDDVIVYSGGGGAGRSGVTNAIIAAQLFLDKRDMVQLHEHKLSRDEDAPMTMHIHRQRNQLAVGINSTPDKLKAGENDHLRIFDWTLEAPYDKDAGKEKEKEKEKEKTVFSKFTIQPSRADRSLNITNPEHYQKVTTFSPNGRLLATASTDGQLALQRFPALTHVWKTVEDFSSDEIYDADFSHSDSHVAFTSSSKLFVYSTTPSEQSDADGEGTPQVIQTIKNPALGGKGPCTFRAARFGRGEASRERLFTVVNAAASPSQGRGAKAKVRKSFITAWDADTWDLIETRHVSDRPVTAFDLSPDGRFLAYGSSDLSVGVLDAKTLRPLIRILHAHDFPPTALRFNPSSSLLVSASADNTLRVITIPDMPTSRGAIDLLTESKAGVYLTLLTALIMVLLAFWAQKHFT